MRGASRMLALALSPRITGYAVDKITLPARRAMALEPMAALRED
jgi:hypothetical protein